MPFLKGFHILFYLVSFFLVFILTIFAPAALGTAYTRVEALAVSLEAPRLLAVASLLRKTAVPRPPLLHLTPTSLKVLRRSLVILAGYTRTIRPAPLRRRKTFAIHLEAECFLASASNLLFLGGVGGRLYQRRPLSEGVLELWVIMLGLWDADILGDIEGKIVHCIYHFKRMMNFGEILDLREGIEGRLDLLGHGWC
jgi:hypothetical protein